MGINHSRIHQQVEYIRHLSEFRDEGFAWNARDIEEDLNAVLAFYGLFLDNETEEEIAVLKEELLIIAEEERVSEMGRIYMIEA